MWREKRETHMFEKRLRTRMVDEDTIRNLPLKPVSYDWGKSRGGGNLLLAII